MQKNFFLLLLALLFLTSCSQAPSEPVAIADANKSEERATTALVIEPYSFQQFLDSFNSHFNIFLAKKDELSTDSAIYYGSEGVYAIEIKNEDKYIKSYNEFLNFVKDLLPRDALPVEQEAELDAKKLNALEIEIRNKISELGFSESVAIEEVFFMIYMDEAKVVGVDLEKWFYFYCAPNIIVKAKARKDTGWTNFNFVGDKEAAIAYLEEQAIDFDNGIGKYRYDANSRAMRNVLCPKLASNFNEGFQRLSESGQI